MLLMTSARILEPDLCDAFAEAGDLGDSFQILAAGIAVQLEVGLQNLQLLL